VPPGQRTCEGRPGLIRDSERWLLAIARREMTTELAEELVRTVEAASARFRTLSEAAVMEKRRPDAWSIKEILGHLIDSAANNHQRFVRAQQGESLTFPGYQQDDWVRIQDYRDAVWGELVEFWRLYNRRLGHVIRRIPDARLDVQCRIGAGEAVTLRFLAEDYLVHLRHHLKQIEECLAA
jgi:hypothetical protein